MDIETWFSELDERQKQEVRFAREYARNFAHGTDGHHRLLIIAKMADMLDERDRPDAPPPQPLDHTSIR